MTSNGISSIEGQPVRLTSVSDTVCVCVYVCVCLCVCVCVRAHE